MLCELTEGQLTETGKNKLTVLDDDEFICILCVCV